jgi:hypothetical protein
MTKTTVQMSQLTREYIEAESRQGETVDETLRRLLEINSTETDRFERLTAFLSEKKTDQVRQVKEVIEDEIGVEPEYSETRGKSHQPVFLFRAQTNNTPVAKIQTTERDSYVVKHASKEQMHTWSGYGNDYTKRRNWEEDLRRRVRGALTTA